MRLCSRAITSTIRPATPLDEIFEETPARRRLGDLVEALTGLCDVSLDAELDPRRRVALRLVAPSLDVSEDGVVLARVAAEVLLDRGELRGKEPFAREHE